MTTSNPNQNTDKLKAVFEQATTAVNFLSTRLNQILIGQQQVVNEVLVALLSGGHILLEGVPGTGKTLLVRTLAQSFSGSFNRIQFTPDLMPSDVTGSYWYDMEKKTFQLRQGPVFTNLLLGDEINRAPAKTQAALLQVMQENAVTLDGKTHYLPQPFMVLATQNPIEQEGTYPLPEAQLDRFMFKILVDYPSQADEVRLVTQVTATASGDLLEKTLDDKSLNPQQIINLQKITTMITVDSGVIDYAVRLVSATRNWSGLASGAGSRAGIALIRGARAVALMNRRQYITPDDVKSIYLPTLRHRVRLSAEMEMEGRTIDSVLQQITDSIPAPRQ